MSVYLIDFGKNTHGEINDIRPAIVISSVSEKDKTFLVVPITSRKPKIKYRGGFFIDNLKYLPNSQYTEGFAKVRKIREVATSRVKSRKLYMLDTDDIQKLIKATKNVINIGL